MAIGINLEENEQVDKKETKSKDPLELALMKIAKDHGKGAIFSGDTKPEKVSVISTGSMNLDRATQIGGLPRGRIVEIMGWESSGKSTITLQAIANAQKEGLICALIDGEHSFDPKYAKALGVDVDALLISQPDWGEQGYAIAETLLDSGRVGLIVIDSQTALLPKKRVDGEIGEGAMGLHSRLMSEVVPKIMIKASKNNCLVIFISQFREKLGVVFGDPRTTNGGHALKFYAHMRLEVSRSVSKEDKAAETNEVKVKIIKNKLGKPFKEASFYINWGEGVDVMQEVLDNAIDLDIIKQAGSWFSYGDSKIGQGRETVLNLLIDNEELFKEIKEKVISAFND